jgi:hypothetical protein
MLTVAPLAAQETRGMIFGRITDAQSATVASARVTVTNVDTNTSLLLVTNETGYYEANFLIPGNYRVTVEASGFKKSIRGGIELPLGSRVEIGIRMELGAVVESVSVTAEAPLVDTNDLTSGRVMDNRSVMDLPVLANSALFLARMAPGVQTEGINIRWGLHSNSVGGGYDAYAHGNVGGVEYSIDGVPNMTMDRRPAQLPYSDTLAEFKIETNSFDVSVGHTSNVRVTMMSRAGTNQLHGTATYQHWQQRWQGQRFFVKQVYYRDIAAAMARGDTAAAAALSAQNITPPGRYNNLALSAGGPVIVPGLFNGKDRLFFYISVAGVRSSRTEMSTDIVYTIPTMQHRQGDFSDLLKVLNGSTFQVYDPLTIRSDPARAGHYIRDPMPGNIVPANRFSPVYKAYVGFLPQPNNNPLSPTAQPLTNYVAVAQPNIYSYYTATQRMDYHYSSRSRFFGKWTWNEFNADVSDWMYPTARGLGSLVQNRNGIAATIDWVYTPTSHTILDVAIAGNSFADGTLPGRRETYKPSDLGLPSYMDAQAGDQTMLPTINTSGYKSVGGTYPNFTRAGTMTAKADLTNIRGPHSIRAGFEAREQYRTGGGGGYPSGTFSFDNAYVRRNDDTFTPAGSIGLSWAAFMLGVPTSASLTQPATYALRNPYYGWYLQDNWRVSRRLSLNFGLRAEYELGGTERYDRALGPFDAGAKLPISDAAEAAYARSPISELTSQLQVRGGSLYVGNQGASRRLNQNQLMWLPRAAASYLINSKTLVRGGYGIYYDSVNVMNRSVNQLGYGPSTSATLTNDFGVHWLANGSPLLDPFAVRSDGTRFNTQVGNALGSMAVAGTGYTYWAWDTRHARQQRWRVSLQRQLGSRTMVEASYSGAATSDVYTDKNMNPLPEQFWSTGLVRNDATTNLMNGNVTNPFLLSNFNSLRTSDPLLYSQLNTRGFFTGTTVRRSQLLRQYPHLSSLSQTNGPFGESRTDDLILTLGRRFAKGFNLNVAYTRLRSDARTLFHNEFDPEPFWIASNSGRPHRFSSTSVIELPFGKGRALAKSRLGSKLLGGFQVSVTYEWQPGPMIGFGNLFYYGNVEDIPAGNRTLDQWFNTDGFERTAAKGPNTYHVRIFPERLQSVRVDMTNNWNVNLQREFKFSDRTALQMRMDCMNLQNRSQFAGPGTNPYNTDFGRVTTQTAAMNRFIQVQARLRF